MTHYETPDLPEHVNAPDSHPLREFLGSLLAVAAIIGVLCVVVWWSASWLARQSPFGWEQALVGDQVLGPFSVAAADDPRSVLLQDLATRLQAVMALPADMHIQVHYSDADIANAFATLGGHVVITQGLLDLMDSENALAMVLAHEIAHVQHRDPIGSLGGGLALGLLVAAITGGDADITGLGASLTQLSFSRAQERAADEAALRAVRALYGHTHGAARFFEAIATSDPGATLLPGFLSTHPHVQDRLQRIRQSEADAPANPITHPLPQGLAPTRPD